MGKVKVKFSTSSILKKINKDNFDKHKKNERKKNMQGNTITIDNVSWENLQL